SLLSVGVLLINLQMAGLIAGGLFWGILGDRRGRLAVLFGSILTYSVANLLNAGIVWLPEGFAIPAYGFLRFVAGVGLAGELGAAVTLVSEACSAERRGLATAIVASMGIDGAVFAGWVAERFHWTTAYWVGGVMGLALLFARVQLSESALFRELEARAQGAARGDWWSLLIEKKLRGRYLGAIAQGMPIWFIVGVLLTFSPEIAKELRLQGNLEVGRAIMHCYAGAVLGDFLAGVWSQWLRRRRAAVASFLLLTAIGVAIFLNFHDRTVDEFYQLSAYLGFASGYWAVLLSSTAEQFGTNLRSTVSSTVPNFIRATVIPLSALFVWLGQKTSLLFSGTVISAAILLLAAWSLFRSRETFGASLDFIEETPRPEGIVFFDGVCNLCNALVDACMTRGLAGGSRGRLKFASLQGQTAARLLPPELRPGQKDVLSIVFYDPSQPKNPWSVRSQAVLKIGMAWGGALGLLALVLGTLPRWLTDLAYRAVARLRYFLFGRRTQCRLPTPQEQEWLLP
ncbi:MAG: MFS transporter, partial [Oligoflexia bacterium]